MNEPLLKALIELLALLSNIENLTNQKVIIPFTDLQENLEQKLKNLMARKSLVQWYLNQEISRADMPTYVKLYDNLMENAYQISVEQNQIEISPFNYKKVYQLAEKLNSGLNLRQKLMVYMRLLEYVLIDKKSIAQAIPIFLILAEKFNISKEHVNSIIDFLTSDEQNIAHHKQLLYVDNTCATNLQTESETYKTYNAHGFKEKMLFLSIPEVPFLFLKYFKSGLSLNGHLISPNRTYAFTPGSKLTSSDGHPLYFSLLQACFFEGKVQDRVVLTAENVEYTFKTGNKGIQSINISEETGTMVGIMGGSGSGKSTLLNVLNGNLTPSAGKVTINGFDVHHQKKAIEGVIGYVSQDDLLIEELTVFQNLFYNSKLCFADLSNAQITEKVNALLSTLGLSEAANLRVGNPLDKIISGGQRKRLNIALELIRKPKVLFLDEPTSGLSSQDSENIIDFIKELSLKGQLIFVVIHQPSSDIFKMFDKMVILDIGGYPIYYGNPLESLNYFKRKIDHAKSEENECPVCGNVNPEVVFEIIESKILDNYGHVTQNRSITPKQWFNYYLKEIEPHIEFLPEEKTVPENNFVKPNAIGQFLIFLKRDVLSKIKNTQYVLINFFEAPFLALLLAYFLRYFPTDSSSLGYYTYFENSNIPVYIFISVVVSLFLGLSVSAEEIIRDRKIRRREAFLNLNKISYLNSKIVYLFALSAVQMFCFIIIGNSILEVKGMLWDYWLILFSSAAFSNLLGLNISASLKSVVTVYILIPFLIIPQIIFSGVLVPFEELNPSTTSQEKVPFIGEVMISRWAFEALAVNQFKNNKYEREFYSLNKEITHAHFMKNYWIAELDNANRDIYQNYEDASKSEQVELSKQLILNEIAMHTQKTGFFYLTELDSLKGSYYSKSLYYQINTYLGSIKGYYNKLYNKLVHAKDNQIKELIKQNGNDNAYFNQLRLQYKNESLSNILTNRNEAKKIVRINNKLLQRENVVYVPANSFRTPYFTPEKALFGFQVPTYFTNLIVIWFFTIALIILLYIDGFKKIGTAFKPLSKIFRNLKSKP